MDANVRKKVDETITDICDWIQKELRKDVCLESQEPTARMVKALAELVSAREC